MTDIFQFSNVYAVKPEITRLLEPKSGLSRECLQYITLPRMYNARYEAVPLLITFVFGADATPPPLSRVFALYCGLQYGSSVRDWIEENQVASLPIDVR